MSFWMTNTGLVPSVEQQKFEWNDYEMHLF